MFCSSSARIFSNSKLPSIIQRQNFAAPMSSSGSSCIGLTNHSSFFLLLPWIHARNVPKNGRSNPRIFNCSEVFANAHSASERETVSGWNIPRLQESRPTHHYKMGLTSIAYQVSSSRSLLRRGASGFFFPGVRAVAFQVAVHTRSPDPQKLRGPQPVAPAHLQHPLDVHLAHLFERKWFPVVASQRTRLPVLQLLRQIRQIDEVSRRRYARAGDDILHLAHISRPPVPQQDGLRPPRQPENVFSIRGVVFLQEKLHQQRNIFQPLRQRGNADLDRTQPVKKIFPKMSRQHLRSQIPVGRGDQPHVDLPHFGRAHS